MNLFEIVKYGVSCREAAELYGVEVNRYVEAVQLADALGYEIVWQKRR